MATRRSARERRRKADRRRGHALSLVALRGVVGALFVGHGSQKLFGAFDGAGLEATAEGYEQMGLRPGRAMATTAGATEVVGGSLLALGAATPLPSAMLTGVMVTAIDKVHRRNGIWAEGGGFEYNAVLLAVLFALADVGPGKLSIDHLRGRQRHGLHWAIMELALGLAGFAALRALGERGSEVPGAAPQGPGSPLATPDGPSGAEHDGAGGRDTSPTGAGGAPAAG